MSDKMKLIMEAFRENVESPERDEESLALEVALLVFEKGGGLEMQMINGVPAMDEKAKSLVPAVIANQQLEMPPSTEAIIKQLYYAHKQYGPDVEYSMPQWDKEKGYERTSDKYTNSALEEMIDEEIGAYLEENSVSAGAVHMAPDRKRPILQTEEGIDEAMPGKMADPKAHKFSKGSRDSYTDKFGRKIPFSIDDCDLELKDVPSTYPQGHPIYDGKPVDPETGMPLETITVHGMQNRHKLHKWMCKNPKSKPIPVTAKAPNDEFQGTVGSGAPFPTHPGAKKVFKEEEPSGIKVRLQEI